jgi:hypothetical protein
MSAAETYTDTGVNWQPTAGSKRRDDPGPSCWAIGDLEGQPKADSTRELTAAVECRRVGRSVSLLNARPMAGMKSVSTYAPTAETTTAAAPAAMARIRQHIRANIGVQPRPEPGQRPRATQNCPPHGGQSDEGNCRHYSVKITSLLILLEPLSSVQK